MNAPKNDERPIDRATAALTALKAVEHLIGQIRQLESNGSDLAILLSLIIENLDDAIDDMHQQNRQLSNAAANGGAA